MPYQGSSVQHLTPNHKKVPFLIQNIVNYLASTADFFVVQAAIVHFQFEVIHPFTDGNGRIGRLLIYHLLSKGIDVTCDSNSRIVLYLCLSRQFRIHKNEYFKMLATCFEQGKVEWWINWFVGKVEKACDGGVALAHQLQDFQTEPVAKKVKTAETAEFDDRQKIVAVINAHIALPLETLVQETSGIKCNC